MLNIDIFQTLDSLLLATLETVINRLQSFLNDPNFADKINLVFGNSWDIQEAEALLQDLASGNKLPKLEIVTSAEINGGYGAFDRINNTIYISREFLAKNINNPDVITNVLLEEFGHYLDAQLNDTDTPGDEGAIFAAIVQEKNLSASELASLKQENDTTTITVDGQTRTIELSATYGNITLDGSSSDWVSGDRIASSSGGQGTFNIFAKYAGDAYVFAVQSDSTAIGANTTFFLNTDRNSATGGNYGAEYFVNFFTDSIPYLYRADGTYIKPLDYFYSPDSKFVEFAVSAADIGNPTAINLIGDVNDSAFFPSDYSTGFQYTVSSVPPAPVQTVFGSVTVDGSLNDWSASDRLDYLLGTGQPGYETYGKFTGEAFVFGIKAPTGTIIGENTTIWLDTDRNSSTGYQIFAGTFGGAEFQINIDLDGKAYLYQATGSSTLQRVSNIPLSFAFDSAKQVLEVAVPTALLGSTPSAINVYADVNNTTFLPGDYTLNNYTVFANQTLPTRIDPTNKKIGIVYSETSAEKYFSKTAYSQLFMSVQDEAMMAGIPFDLLTEADLKDMSKLVNYDTLIFPSFQNVKKADLPAIQDNLTNLVYKYGTSIIAAGNFMTNDETGAALSDAYSRMKTLLNLQPQAFGTSTVSLNYVPNPILPGYTAGETIRTYNPQGWNVFSSVDPSKTTTLVNQTLSSGTYNAVVATQTGGRNVHFATEGYLGDTNLLWQALQWTTYNNQPSVKLSLTRNNSLFLSRNDMDLSQESYSVKPLDGTPGIYDRMLPIVEQWKQAYNFVGSYYINIGNNPAGGEYTDWSVSKPYYDRLMAAGNEIGTHSYTHFYEYQGYTPPENTNIATDAQLKFEFEGSKLEIQKQLGIPVTGAALPGAPETLETAQKIIQYFDYISGGYSGVGAGYPNGFGYLTPDQKSVYLAPNLYFDFTLIEFGIPVYDAATGTYVPKKLTATEAKAEWVKQFNEVTNHANKPIVMMPWHDYGPTNWDNKGYTTDMFAGLIQTAYNSGAEFTTLNDASQRIKAFEQTTLQIVSSSSTAITATVTPVLGSSLGKFSLDLGTGYTIKNVNNWYAYDKDSVLLPTFGGTFTINLGATPDDVTRITTLPMRSELLSVWGNGEDLEFSFMGDGQVILDLKNPTGMKLSVGGADSYSLNGELLTLNFNSLNYLNPLTPRNVRIDLDPDRAPIVLNPIANVTVTEPVPAVIGGIIIDTIQPTVIDLSNVFTDPDPNDRVSVSVFNNSNQSLVSTTLNGNLLTLNYAPNQFGTAQITLRGTSNGLTADNTFTVTASRLYNHINGTSGNNKLNGTAARDKIFGLGRNDQLDGKAGDDVLYGGDGRDTLTGGAGNDFLVGGNGDDIFDGGSGNDTLIGVEPTSSTPGRGEIDRLKGGSGADLFILGDKNQVYYNSGNSTNAGLSDYALIEDFKLSEGDRIQLRGSIGDYNFRTASGGLPGGTAIYMTGSVDELIGVVQGVSVNNLNNNSFIFV